MLSSSSRCVTDNDTKIHAATASVKRRHLSASQKAVVAVDMLPHLEAEARKRQLASLQQFSPPVSQKIDEREHMGRSTERAAQVTGTNRQYVSDAKRIQQYAPAVLDAVRDGASGNFPR